jgi:hypothetical protein
MRAGELLQRMIAAGVLPEPQQRSVMSTRYRARPRQPIRRMPLLAVTIVIGILIWGAPLALVFV